MSISAKDVAALRAKTGAGMMDCKKALTETGGDIEQAIDILRKKGEKVSAKRADRDANEGAVFAYSDDSNTASVLIELNCETDFVARNDDFQQLGKSIASLAGAHKPASLDELKALSLDGRLVSDHLTDAMGKIGEKIDVSKYEFVNGEGVITYIHPGARIGVVVAFENVSGDITATGKDIAMQIAAMSPLAIDKDGVPKEMVDKEIEIGKEQALASGKPEAIIEKIAMGKLNKFFKENTLLHQDFVKDTSKTVQQHLKEANPDLKIKAFRRVQLGAN